MDLPTSKLFYIRTTDLNILNIFYRDLEFFLMNKNLNKINTILFLKKILGVLINLKMLEKHKVHI